MRSTECYCVGVWVTMAAAAIIAAICMNKASVDVEVCSIQLHTEERRAHADHTYLHQN